MPLTEGELRIMFGEDSWPSPDPERDNEQGSYSDDDDWLDDDDDAVAWGVSAAEAAGVLCAALAGFRGAPLPSERLAAASARLRAGLDSCVDP